MNFFQKCWHALSGVFSQKHLEAFDHDLSILLPYARQAVDVVAAATPNRSVAEIKGLLDKVGVPYSPALLTGTPTTSETRGYLLSAANAVLTHSLEQNWPTVVAQGLKLAGEGVQVATGIPAPLLDTAAQMAYGLIATAAKAHDKTAVPAAV